MNDFFYLGIYEKIKWIPTTLFGQLYTRRRKKINKKTKKTERLSETNTKT